MKDRKSMMRPMCKVQFKDRKRNMDIILMLSLNGTIDQKTMSNSVRWSGHVYREDGG